MEILTVPSKYNMEYFYREVKRRFPLNDINDKVLFYKPFYLCRVSITTTTFFKYIKKSYLIIVDSINGNVTYMNEKALPKLLEDEISDKYIFKTRLSWKDAHKIITMQESRLRIKYKAKVNIYSDDMLIFYKPAIMAEVKNKKNNQLVFDCTSGRLIVV